MAWLVLYLRAMFLCQPVLPWAHIVTSYREHGSEKWPIFYCYAIYICSKTQAGWKIDERGKFKGKRPQKKEREICRESGEFCYCFFFLTFPSLGIPYIFMLGLHGICLIFSGRQFMGSLMCYMGKLQYLTLVQGLFLFFYWCYLCKGREMNNGHGHSEAQVNKFG